MVRFLACAILAAAATTLWACGDNYEHATPPDDDVLDQLAALPGVRVAEWTPPSGFTGPTGVRFFDLRFTMPIDHDDPSAGTFELYAALIHRDLDAPLVVYAGGYQAGWTRYFTEPAVLTNANQVSLEYRFYGGSVPDGGIPWSKLRVAQSGADEHAIVQLLARVYGGKRIATGGSKGGENALFQHHLYPGDYDGVVAYVAPVITDFPDLRYAGLFDRIGVPSCRDRLRGDARKMLVDRDVMDADAAAGAAFDIAGVDHAVETGIVELEFSFWMTRGERDCGAVPDPSTASDAALWQFLDDTSAPSAYGDDELATSGTQYIYQDHVELGYPIWTHDYLDDLMRFSYEDWSAYLPPGEPHPYDPTAARDLAAWIDGTADHIMLIMGEWDPWAAGGPTVAPGRDAHVYWVHHGSHWSSGIYSLGASDQAAAVASLRGWAGVDGAARLGPVPPPPAPMATLGPDDPRVVRAARRAIVRP